MWIVDRGAYRALYERFSDSERAEDLLWAAARQPRYDDCESGVDCWLERPLESVATYWSRYPRGRYLTEAISMAAAQLRPLARCGTVSRLGPSSGELLRELRTSLRGVAGEDAEPLLSLLERIEACGPPHPEAGDHATEWHHP